MPTNLFNQRRAAADASGGISSDVIYNSVERLMAERQLRGRFLDFGAGTGTFAERIYRSRRFLTVSAADIMSRPFPLPRDIERIEQDLNLPISGQRDRFDVIAAVEVIEHLENPRAMMRALYRMLRPGGTVILTTPNNESWRAFLALVVRGHFVSFGDSCYPAHITALLRRDLNRIFLETGFSKPDFLFTNDGSIPAMPRLHWQQITAGLLRGLRYSDNVLCITGKGKSQAADSPRPA